MLALQALERSLTVPAAAAEALGLKTTAVKRAYLIAPQASKDLPQSDLPCFINWPDVAEDLGGLGQLAEESTYTVQIDFYAPPAVDKGAEIALAFFDALWNALKAQKPAAARLAGSVDYLQPRAERPLLETLEWNGKQYPGFHVFLDLTVFEAVVA
jgi:hypothetical protein